MKALITDKIIKIAKIFKRYRNITNFAAGFLHYLILIARIELIIKVCAPQPVANYCKHSTNKQRL
jgi:hypothetical protein